MVGMGRASISRSSKRGRRMKVEGCGQRGTRLIGYYASTCKEEGIRQVSGFIETAGREHPK